jgi:class 3 adenylate cyclase
MHMTKKPAGKSPAHKGQEATRPAPALKKNIAPNGGRRGDAWGNVLRGYRRVLFLGTFAEAGRSPKILDVEVAVCFADLRGFTDYVHRLQKDGQDNKVQHFLRDYFQIYPQGVLQGIWSFEPDDLGAEMTESQAELKKLVVPVSYKNLGDGMMIVWELQTASSMRIQGLATRYIFNIIEEMQKSFADFTTDLGDVQVDSYSTHAGHLKLGFGLARGHAWRLDFGRHLPLDYAGSIVNLAARLQGLARPSGIVAQLGFSESLFKGYVKKGKGQIRAIASPKGLGTEPIEVWATKSVILTKAEA